MDYNFFKTGSFIRNFVTQGHERSIKAKKNIMISFIIQGISLCISLIILPLTLSYVDASQYGIWLTLSSIVAWFSFFDIGLTQGLRNKFAEARAKESDSLAQAYVSTTYAILTVIFCGLWLVFIIINHWLNWSSILKVPEDMRPEVTTLAIIVFSYFCVRFVFKIIGTLLTADQKPAISSLIDLLGQILSLIIIFILVKTTEGSLIKLGVALCVSPIIILLGANVFFFSGRYKKFRPKLSLVDLTYGKDLLNLGLVFFVIQVAGIIQYQTANIIIARNLGTADVTSYNVVYRYFGVINMLSAIFLTPLWSASTEAFLKNDLAWIKNAMKKYNLLNLLLIASGILMLVFSAPIYRIWLGEGKVDISFSLSFWGFIYFNVIVFGAKYVSFLNGINALRIQFLASLLSPLLYILVALVMIKHFKLGASSLFIASVLANFNAYLLAPIQYHKIINRNKKGIWIK
jgi:O-antigen/teichoic acid export membrane protein